MIVNWKYLPGLAGGILATSIACADASGTDRSDGFFQEAKVLAKPDPAFSILAQNGIETLPSPHPDLKKAELKAILTKRFIDHEAAFLRIFEIAGIPAFGDFVYLKESVPVSVADKVGSNRLLPKGRLLAIHSSPSPKQPYFRLPSEIPDRSAEQPLAGVRIALDPGHLGGQWARMEGRSFQVEGYPRFQEGDWTLAVAKQLKPELVALGAEVHLLRDDDTPATKLRPGDLKGYARDWLLMRNATSEEPSPSAVQHWAELIFYRVAEMRARARLVNQQIRPDLVLSIHFDAAPWPDPEKPSPVDFSKAHALIHGAYSKRELALDDQRHELMRKLLNTSWKIEAPLAVALMEGLAETTGLPAFHYSTPNARSVEGSDYVWARNILATRLMACPVVLLEVHHANSQSFLEMLSEQKAGFDASGTCPIIELYVEGVVLGLKRFFSPE
jgi:N-acetylmuramoyl-L-alanine amidase